MYVVLGSSGGKGHGNRHWESDASKLVETTGLEASNRFNLL